MKKMMILLACLLLIIPAFFSFSVFADTPQIVKVVSNWAYVYETADLTSAKLATVQFASEHELVSPLPILDSENNSFLNIKFEESSAFILTGTVSPYTTNVAIIPYLRPNTSIKQGINNISLYIKNANAFEAFTDVFVNDNTVFRIVDGYKQTNEYTKIQTTIDNQIVTAYVKTNILAPYGMKRWLKIVLIFASILILALITYLGIRAKRRRS